MTRVRNDLFDPQQNLHRGRSKIVEAAWYICKLIFFLSAFPWSSSWKSRVLRAFGAKVGRGVVIKPRVNIHFPWKLEIGDYSWIGEEVNLLNLEAITIGQHGCISQRAFLCAGNHNYRDVAMSYRNAPIFIREGAWIGAQVFVGPGITVGVDAVATAGSIVIMNLPNGTVCSGNPCIPVKSRWKLADDR